MLNPKKLFRSFSSALILICVSLTSCGLPKTDSSSSKKNNRDLVKFDWYIHFSWFARHWGDSLVSKYITEKTGVDVNFVVPAGNEGEKLNSLMADNNLPDYITLGWWEGQVNSLIEKGMVYPLDELAQKYCPEFFNVVNNDKMGWFRRSDGHVYGYPNCSYTPSDYEKYKGRLTSNETFLVRKDMYEMLGKPDMSTPEGFLKALSDAKKMFPKIDGLSLIPFGTTEFGETGCSTLQKTLSHFLAIKPEKDGLFTDPELGLVDDPEYVRWLRTFRRANEMGLISKYVFINKRSQIEENAALGRYFCLFYPNTDMQNAQNLLYINDPNSIYIAVKGPANSRGEDPKLAGGSISGWTVTMISKSCRHPEQAIKFLTYLISEEGQYDCNFGILNRTYTKENGVPVLTPEVKALDSADKNQQETDIGVLYTYWMLKDEAWQAQFGLEYAPYVEQPQLWTRPYVESYAVYDGLTLAPDSEENAIYQDLQRKWGKTFHDMILAQDENEFDRLLRDFKKYRDEKGYRKMQEAQTAMMNENKRKLGM